MVARINTSKSISKALNYNEQKMKEGKAEILSASGFIKDVDKLSFYDKLNHFERLISLNDRTVTNTLHVSLNFDPSEQLSNEKLTAIADRYMEQIGFAGQPYLVYRHHDAGHPHIHIVSTNIQSDGKRISMHNMGQNQSEKARKKIETEFGLVKAESKSSQDLFKLVPVNAAKVIYGKSVTKRAIANVLMNVLEKYKYASLPELNAVLKLYNVAAEAGQPGSQMEKFRGLTYRVLDAAGEKVGAPIKASAFYMKPTLAYLEKKFIENEVQKAPHKKRLQASLNWVLTNPPSTLNGFIKGMEKEGISIVLRKGKEDVIYGITYVDHKSRTVFNGSDLGKQYSAKAIVEQCGGQVAEFPVRTVIKAKKDKKIATSKEKKEAISTGIHESGAAKLPAIIPDATKTVDYVPYELKKRKRKKRKRISL